MQRHSNQLASRIQEIRLDKFGTEGVAHVSQAINIDTRTWDNFENGVTMPAWVLLQFIELTDVEPHWLLTGKGERYRNPPAKSSRRAAP